MLLLICALTPLLLGGALPFLRIRPRRGRMAYAVLASAVTSVLAGYLIWQDAGEGIELFRLSDAFVCSLRLDGAGRVYLGLAALLWPLSVLYAVFATSSRISAFSAALKASFPHVNGPWR